MGFFSADNLNELNQVDAQAIFQSAGLQAAAQRLSQLHQRLYAQMRMYNLDLHLITPEQAAVVAASVSTVENGRALCVAYLRTRGQAVTVERLMGREEVASMHAVDAHRHPVIELRVTATALALELILSPDAWWDQQNLLGKLKVARHRQEFYLLLRDLTVAYRMGFWEGTHLSEMHLTAHQFQHPRIMDEWMSTFEPGADWWRVGIWYPFDDDGLQEGRIVDELVPHVRRLYAMYEHLRWTSDNNFREFYRH